MTGGVGEALNAYRWPSAPSVLLSGLGGGGLAGSRAGAARAGVTERVRRQHLRGARPGALRRSALDQAVEELGVAQVLAASVLGHGRNHAQGREGAEERGLQNVGLLLRINPEVIERVVAALERAVRGLDHGVDPRMQLGAQVCRALPVAVLLRLLYGVGFQVPLLVRGQLVRRRPDVFQEVLDLWQHRERSIRLLDAGCPDLPPHDILIDDHSWVEAESVLDGPRGVLLVAHKRDPPGIVLV